MHVRRLRLTNFRCYRALDLDLPSGPIVLAGRNAQGKSSLLEALHLVATTRSPHTGSEREMVNWEAANEPLPHSRAEVELQRGDRVDTVEVVYAGRGRDSGSPRMQKLVKVNGVQKRALDAIGTLNVVLFSPRDLAIVDGAPAERRRFLDVLLCQLDRDYCRELARYNRVLTQRNHLLRDLRERHGDGGELGFWNENLARHGAVVGVRRSRAVAALAELAAAAHAEMAGSPPELRVRYVSSVKSDSPVVATGAGRLPATDYPLDGGSAERPPASVAAGASPGASPERRAATPQGLSPEDGLPHSRDEEAAARAAFLAALAACERRDMARGATSIGPHRDDLELTVGDVDMRVYGSRGQQRTVALALRLAEAQLMHDVSGEQPVVLLDDVLSELDDRRRSLLLSSIGAERQTLITTTTADRLPADFLGRSSLMHVDRACVVAVSPADSAEA
ncbi:MAG: DNA replication/repair protein RecF [Anaerolineae bacterium]